MECVCLDENALEIQLAEQLPEHRPLVVVAGGVTGLADRHAQCRGIQRDLGNERGTPAGGALHRTPQGLAVTHQLIEIRRATRDLGDRPVTDRRAQHRHIHLLEEVAEGGIRWWSPQLQAQRCGQDVVVADGKALEISQALAAAEDSQHGHQQQVPGGKTHAAPHARIWDRPQITDQVETGCGRSGVGQKEETAPPTSTHADSLGKEPCDRL